MSDLGIDDLFAASATAVSFLVYLGPLPQMRQVVADKKLGDIAIFPLWSMALNTILWMLLGYVQADMVLFVSNGVGLICAYYYLSIYVTFAKANRRTNIIAALVAFVSVMSIIVLYLLTLPNQESVESRMGSIAMLASVAMMLSPALSFRSVLETGSDEAVPKTMLYMGGLSSALWFGYGLTAPNQFIIIVNGGGTFFAIAQCAFLKWAASTAQTRLAAMDKKGGLESSTLLDHHHDHHLHHQQQHPRHHEFETSPVTPISKPGSARNNAWRPATSTILPLSPTVPPLMTHHHRGRASSPSDSPLS